MCILSQYEAVIFSLSCQTSFLKLASSLDKFSLNAKFDEHISKSYSKFLRPSVQNVNVTERRIHDYYNSHS